MLSIDYWLKKTVALKSPIELEYSLFHAQQVYRQLS